MIATIFLILISLLTGIILGYQSYATNLKREGWWPIWDWNKPVGQGRLTMIEPPKPMTAAEMLESLERNAGP